MTIGQYIKEAVANKLRKTHTKCQLLVPYSEGALLGEIRDSGTIFTEEYEADGYKITASVDNRILHKTEKYRI